MTKQLRKTNEKNIPGQQFLIKQQFHAGPLPPPFILKEYEQIVPGAAQKIIKMAEKQSSHRIQMESKIIGSDIINSKIGLIFGLIIGVVGIISGAVVAAKGQAFAGSFLSVGSLATLVGVFVYGSQQGRKEKDNKKRRLKK